MSDQNNDETVADVKDESVTSQTATEPTLRARISTWLSKRALSSVIVASVVALLIGIGFGHISTVNHERDRFGNHQMRPDFDHDRRGPGMMGPGSGQFGPGMMGPGNGESGPGNGQGGPGMMGPDDRGPGMMGPGNGLDQNSVIPPQPSASATTN